MLEKNKYKSLFLSEADEKIKELNNALLNLEKNPKNIDYANDAMRAAHTIKSSSAAMQYMNISHLAHVMENLFEKVRLKQETLELNTFELLFKSLDVLTTSIHSIKKNKPELDTSKLVALLLKLSEQGFQLDNAEMKSALLELQTQTIMPIESVKVDVEVLDMLMNLTEELLVEKMRLAELVQKQSNKKNTGFDNLTDDKIKFQNNDGNDAEKYNRFISDKLKEKENQKSDKAEDISEELTVISENFNRLLGDLQYNVTEARMVPLGQLFERFPRMVRDLSQAEKKNIDFNIEGQEIELDRTLIDRLGEPLIHLLRNAVNHGIKDKGIISLRAFRESDKVMIEIVNEGNAINWQEVIESALKKGIIDKVKGGEYLSQIQNPKFIIHNSEIENLLYHPQLSTSEHITETSGRGIGLSIVKSVIEGLGGSVQIESPIANNENLKTSNEYNQKEKLPITNKPLQITGGTKFTLSLPLTLAIIQALLVKVQKNIFALPFSQIDRSVRVKKSDIKKAFDQEVALVGEEDIPIVRLNNLFKLTDERQEIFFSKEEMKELGRQLQAELVVITKPRKYTTDVKGVGSSQIGIVIDEIISEQDIVVKPLHGVLKQSKGFAGITLLGNGRPALILDLTTLV
jgi:two-component system, chemotaxis family, sensor kinase CheA